MEYYNILAAVVVHSSYRCHSFDWLAKLLDDRLAIDKSRLDTEYAYYTRAMESGMFTLSLQIPIDRHLRLAGLARILATTAGESHAIVEMGQTESLALYGKISPELPELAGSVKIAPKVYRKDIMSALIPNARGDCFEPDDVRYDWTA